jgi:hypothetical protein
MEACLQIVCGVLFLIYLGVAAWSLRRKST